MEMYVYLLILMKELALETPLSGNPSTPTCAQGEEPEA